MIKVRDYHNGLIICSSWNRPKVIRYVNQLYLLSLLVTLVVGFRELEIPKTSPPEFCQIMVEMIGNIPVP